MNKDGFEPGQSLTFEQVQALQRKHRWAAQEREEQEEQPPRPRRGRPPKVAVEK